MARLTEQQRDTLVSSLRQIYDQNGTIPMTARVALAKQYGISVEAVTKYISKNSLTYQHQWTNAERKYIWLNFEQKGYTALARKYKVSPLAIKQQVTLMRTVDHDVRKPWER